MDQRIPIVTEIERENGKFWAHFSIQIPIAISIPIVALDHIRTPTVIVLQEKRQETI
jgi:hypothetical protein